MARKVLSKRVVKNLSPEDLAKCRSLNMGINGSMRGSIDPEDVAYMIKDENDMLLSWCLVNRVYPHSNKMLDDPSVMFYTRAKCRNQGLGSRLARQVRKDYPRHHAFGWDNRSIHFFSKTGIRYW